MNRLDKLFNLVKKLNVDGIVITTYPNIFYYSKFTSEDAILYVTDNEAYIITDSRYTLQSKKQAKGFKVVIRKGSYTNELKSLIKSGRILFEETIPYNMYSSFNNAIEATFTAVNIDELRNVKDEEEIKYIKKAANIASECYLHILSFVKPGMKECEVSNEMIRFMKEKGASKESFEIIVASGKRGALPHGVASEKVIEEGDFVTLDFGCIYKGYCSDITRSFMVGKASDKMIEVYNVVKKAQMLALKKVKAGVKACEIDKVARDYITKKGYGKYFTHSTGHGLGVEVHDPMAISSRNELVLEENMIITIEPGIYIPSLGGIRIEDDVLVTKEGCKILTKATKKLISI